MMRALAPVVLALGVFVAGCRSDPSASSAPSASASVTSVAEAPTAGSPIESAPVLTPPVDLPAPASSVATGPVHKKLIGTWGFDASPATKARLVEQFKRTIKDPKEAEQMSKRFEEGLGHMTIEI